MKNNIEIMEELTTKTVSGVVIAVGFMNWNDISNITSAMLALVLIGYTIYKWRISTIDRRNKNGKT